MHGIFYQPCYHLFTYQVVEYRAVAQNKPKRLCFLVSEAKICFRYEKDISGRVPRAKEV